MSNFNSFISWSIVLIPMPSFADRQFYEDWVCPFQPSCCNHVFPQHFFSSTNIYSLIVWPRLIIRHIRWNSTSLDEFARKWNKPVHVFLLRHVYTATIMRYRVSKTTAMLLTFVLSASAHELVMAVVTRKFRWDPQNRAIITSF